MISAKGMSSVDAERSAVTATLQRLRESELERHGRGCRKEAASLTSKWLTHSTCQITYDPLHCRR